MHYEQEFRKKMDKGDVSGAFEICKLGAEAGDDVLQQQLAFMYEFGMGTAENKAECLKWYLIAAENGNATAQFFLGSLFQRGHLVEKNLSQSLHWYKAAAEQGEAFAQYILACDYAVGSHGNQDFHASGYWLREAALQNHAGAQRELGGMLATDWLGKADHEEAHFWNTVSILNGECDHVQWVLEIKEEISTAEPAIATESKAQEFFDNCEMFRATLNAEPNTSPKPRALQFREVECAAKLGDIEAQYKIGSLYYTHYVFRNLKKSSFWLRAAAEQGHVKAKIAVDTLVNSVLKY